MLTLAAGVYDPTVAAVGGWQGIVTKSCFQYMRVGSVVTVSGEVVINTVAAGPAQFYITLPVASDITNTCELAGTGATRLVNEAGYNHSILGRISGDVANDRAIVDFYNNGFLDGLIMSVHFTYLVT